MPRLSILIPWRGSTTLFEDTLVSVLANRPPSTEVIVVHRGQYADPYELRRDVLLVEHDDDAPLSSLLDRGLEVAGGELLHVLGCGVTVHDGWTDGFWRHFEDPDVGSAAPLVVQRQDPGRLVSAGVALGAGGQRRELGRGRRVDSAPQTAWGPSLLAAFYRSEALRALGGFSSATGDLLDVDIAASLRQAGYLHRMECSCCLAADASLEHDGAPPVEVARHRERLYWRHASALGWLGAAAHAAQAAGQLAISLLRGRFLAEVQGRAGALLQWSAYREHARRIRQAAELRQQHPSFSLQEERQRRQGGTSQRRAA